MQPAGHFWRTQLLIISKRCTGFRQHGRIAKLTQYGAWAIQQPDELQQQEQRMLEPRIFQCQQ